MKDVSARTFSIIEKIKDTANKFSSGTPDTHYGFPIRHVDAKYVLLVLETFATTNVAKSIKTGGFCKKVYIPLKDEIENEYIQMITDEFLEQYFGIKLTRRSASPYYNDCYIEYTLPTLISGVPLTPFDLSVLDFLKD